MSTPFELTDEQAEELQVLASIYEDRFEHVCLNPATVRVEIKGAGVTFGLEVEFASDYPNALPKYALLTTAGRFSGDLDAMLDHLRGEMGNFIGVPMVFSMVSCIEEYLEGLSKRQEEASSSRAGGAGPEGKERAQRAADEFVTMKGGAVTKDSFNAWWATFSSHLAQVRAANAKRGGGSEGAADGLVAGTTGGRKSGRQLFEENRSLATSDVVFIGAQDTSGGGDVEVNEASIYEGLDDLSIEESDEEAQRRGESSRASSCSSPDRPSSGASSNS